MPSVQALGGVGGPAGLVLFGGAAFRLPAAAAFVARGCAFRRRRLSVFGGNGLALALIGADAQRNPQGAAEQADDYRDLRQYPDVAFHLRPIRAEGVAGPDEDRVPHSGPRRGQGGEFPEVHARHARRNRDEGAEDRDHSAEKDRPGSPPVEERLGFLDVRGFDQREFAHELACSLPAEQSADAVERPRADHRSSGAPQDRPEQREAGVSGARREARQRKDHFRGERREQILQRDEGRGAESAEVVHDVYGPSGDA